MAYVAIGGRCLLGVVFAVAVAGKLRGPAAFAGSLVEAGLVRQRWRYPIAVGVVGAELATLALLAATPLAGPAAALSVLAVLTGGIVLTLRRGVRARCRCFGGTAEVLGRVHVVRNAALAAIAVLGLLAGSRPAPVHAAGVAVALAAGAVLGLLAVRLDDIIHIVRPSVP